MGAAKAGAALAARIARAARAAAAGRIVWVKRIILKSPVISILLLDI
jgi:hypothetical protein